MRDATRFIEELKKHKPLPKPTFLIGNPFSGGVDDPSSPEYGLGMELCRVTGTSLLQARFWNGTRLPFPSISGLVRAVHWEKQLIHSGIVERHNAIRKTHDYTWAIIEDEGVRVEEDIRRIQDCVRPATCIFYGSGTHPAPTNTGWDDGPCRAAALAAEAGLSFNLRYCHQGHLTHEIVKRNCFDEESTPWVDLYRVTEVPYGEWRYGLEEYVRPHHAYSMGQLLYVKWFGDRPQRFAPYNNCKKIILYPCDWNGNSDWRKNFVMMLRGADGRKEWKNAGELQGL